MKTPISRPLARRILACTWAAPYSALGLCAGFVMVLFGGRWATHDGTLEVGGGHVGRLASRLPSPFCFCAITLGHVILGTDHETLRDVRAHEQVHVRQYERWGIFFAPAYVLSSALALLRGQRPYLDNHFEQEARAKAPARQGARTS